jgi:hypothetical protein
MSGLLARTSRLRGALRCLLGGRSWPAARLTASKTAARKNKGAFILQERAVGKLNELKRGLIAITELPSKA